MNNLENDVRKLSDEELLQAFLPTDSVQNLVKEYNNIYDVVLNTSMYQYCSTAKIGIARAKKIIYLRELIQRFQEKKQQDMNVIHTPEDVNSYFRFLAYKKQEEFWVLLLDVKNQIIKSQMITKGIVNASLVGMKEVFNLAIQNMASSIVCVHCHPSGWTIPSEEDKNITKRLVKAGKILDIDVIDHVIIAKYGYCSIKEKFSSLFI